ncbi:hypothetical protein EC957_002761 [Mortierella hygrophila]|uniref:Uncharacterized protein n=1 Tax=Mortierella hygrophila TaxID=979708 RepID=A0A9P6F4C4_9FUNG|nr:hypothetical protein EC957_002761 [Mortierella hygrophila]
MAEHTNPNANYNVGGVGVPGAQVELMENIQSQVHQLLQQQQLQSDQKQSAPVQQQYSQQAHTRDPLQFDHQYQQSFFTQPTDNGAIQTNSAMVDAEMAAPAIVPANTNVVGDGSPGLSVGGVGVPGARVETLDLIRPQAFYQQQQQQDQTIQQQQHVAGNAGAPAQQPFISTASAISATTKPGELDTVQQVSGSRPPVGPFDPSAEATTTEPAVLPAIFLQREASMRHDQQTPAQTTTTTTTSSSTEATPPHKIHVASSGAVAAAAAAHAADESSRGRRRSSLAVLADKIRSSTSRSRSSSLSRRLSRTSSSTSRSRSSSLSHRLSRTISRHSFGEEEEEESVGGPYKDVKIAQQEHLAKLRAEQEKNGITHNVDGLPIPPAPERQRRRSSVTRILGLDKPLLSR